MKIRMPLAAAAVVLLHFASCGMVRSIDEIPCAERCRYNYKDCSEEVRSDSGHITFSFVTRDMNNSLDLSTDYCTAKYRQCLKFCEKQRTPSER